MDIWYRVRLKLALSICPELTVEARLKAAASVGFFDTAAAREAAKSIRTKRAVQGAEQLSNCFGRQMSLRSGRAGELITKDAADKIKALIVKEHGHG